MKDKTIQTISINPVDLLGILRKSQLEMKEAIYQWIAMELFREKKISAGKAAELAQLSVSQFMDLTRHQRIAWISSTEEELDKETTEALALGNSIIK